MNPPERLLISDPVEVQLVRLVRELDDEERQAVLRVVQQYLSSEVDGLIEA